MIECVGVDRIARPGECGNHTRVGEVSAPEEQGCVGLLESRDVPLERFVCGVIAADQPRGGRSSGILSEGGDRGCRHARVAGQAQVVVRGEVGDGVAGDDDLRTGAPVHRAERPSQPGAAQLIELVGEHVVERRIAGGDGRGDASGTGRHG